MRRIFVFGSNLAGRHRKGAALFAKRNHGAIRGIGEGIQGDAYGIPTKDHLLNSRSLLEIEESVNAFIRFAKDRPELIFDVSEIGCKLAGYTPAQIGPMFDDAPENCNLPTSFLATFSWPE